MQAVAGMPLTATLAAPPDVTTLGARLERPVTREIIAAWQPATLLGSTWTVALDGPLEPGDYLLVWRTPDPEPPAYETFVPVCASAS